MKSITSTIAALCLACMLLVGCKSSTNATRTPDDTVTKTAPPSGSTDPMLEKLKPALNITSVADGYTLSFSAGAGGAPDSPTLQALRSISSITFQIFAPDDRLLETLTTDDIVSSGMMNSETGEASIMATANRLYSPKGSVMPGSYVVMTVHGADGTVTRSMRFATALPPPVGGRLALTLEVEPRGTGAEFILTVTRKSPPSDDEYRPSGERFRIELQNDVGETIWSSNTGNAFTQAIGEVEPREVGESVTYRVYWDGQSDLTRSALESGRYRVTATILAKPKPYMLREEFTWSGR